MPRKSPSLTAKKKPAKPHRDYPLYPHASGQWAKKIRGETHYFGKWDNPQAALERYLAQKDRLLAGQSVVEGLTVTELVNHYLTDKADLVKSGELKQYTHDDYRRILSVVVDVMGRRSVESLRPDDFKRLRGRYAKTHGVQALRKDVTVCRSLFLFAYDMDLIDQPVKFGKFKVPKKAALRLVKKHLTFEPSEVRDMVKEAGPQLRGMILLGINCGFGNMDCAMLPWSAIADSWVIFPRTKNGINRRCPLWTETVEALAELPRDKSHVFQTRSGQPWTPKSKKGVGGGPISYETRKLLVRLGLKTPGRNYYTLRRMFETIGGGTADQVAVNFIMGHVDPSMAAVYRQGIDDSRLIAVSDHVREWFRNSG